MSKGDYLEGWVHWSEAAEWANYRTTHGFEKPFRDWLDLLGVEYAHNVLAKGSSFVNLRQLKARVSQVAQMRAEGLDDSDIFEAFERQ